MIRTFQKAVIVIGGAALLLISGYVVGNIHSGKAPFLVAPSEDMSVEVHPETTASAQATPEPYIAAVAQANTENATTTAYMQYDEVFGNNTAEKSKYTLKCEGENLYLYDVSGTVQEMSIPEGVDEQFFDTLEIGMQFNSLEEVECWFESFDT